MSDEADDDANASLRPSIGGGAAAFAASIARRARMPRARRAPIARVWRRPVPAPLPRATLVGVTFAPVLRISIVASQSGKASARPEERARAPHTFAAPDAFVPPVARTLAVPDAPSRPSLGVTTPDTASTVARLVARGARTDASLTSRAKRATLAIVAGEPAPDHASRRFARPVTRVLRARHIEAPAEPNDASARAPFQKSVAAAVPSVLSASEVNRVTEHVLRTMDRRISAFRERQGRS